MRTWIKAALAAAATALLLMYGIDYLETHFRAMKWVQQDIVNYHERFQKTMSGER